jgi:iron complex transport system ATP-binding protein
MAQHIAVVLTEQPDVKQLTVSEIVGMGRMPYTGFFGSMDNDDRHIVQQALQDTGLARFANRYFDALSDGERQKVMIAKALAQQTPVIVLDEPTAFLDYPSKVDMMKILHHLAIAQGKTILLSTHDLELALQHADRLLILRDDLGEMTRASLADYIRSLR